jgi:hypothetical protein
MPQLCFYHPPPPRLNPYVATLKGMRVVKTVGVDVYDIGSSLSHPGQLRRSLLPTYAGEQDAPRGEIGESEVALLRVHGKLAQGHHDYTVIPCGALPIPLLCGIS